LYRREDSSTSGPCILLFFLTPVPPLTPVSE
jgi:hypothetical protein